MGFKNRFGNFLIFWGLISLFIFFASLYTPDKDYNYFAFLLGIVLLWIGIPLRRAQRPPPPPAKQAAPPPKKRGPPPPPPKGPAAQAGCAPAPTTAARRAASAAQEG